MSQTNIVLLNAFNPLGTDMNPRGVESLFDMWKDHAPPNEERGGQEVVWLGRQDLSVFHPDTFARLESDALDEAERTNEWQATQRGSASNLINSFCPRKAVDILVNYRKLPTDFAGVIAFDHELPAWCSPLHGAVYLSLCQAIDAVYPNARVYEYGGLVTDFVRTYSGRAHEVAVMDAVGICSPCRPMTHLYVPGPEYIANVKRWGQMCRDNVKRWKARIDRIHYHKTAAVAVNPILQTGTNWSDGRPVPPEVMAETIESIADAGFPIAIWQAGNTPEQFDTVCNAIGESVAKAVAMVEGRKG